MATPRILGTFVPAAFPPRGPVTALIYGEAPGPRGADKSGIPFFGDRSGLLVYRVLVEAGRCTLNVDLDTVRWDGEALREAGAVPRFIGTALSNAYPVCPTEDGAKFRAPTKRELTSAENVARVAREIERARDRGLAAVITLGRHADSLLGGHLGLRDDATLQYHQINHPSPLGLLWLKRRGGAGTTMAELQREWMVRFRAMLPEA